MPDDRDRTGLPSMSKYAGMGLEFAGAVGGFALLGWWIDRHWQIEKHWGVLVCGLLGLIGGMYNFIRQAFAATREAARPRPPEDRPPGEDSNRR